MGWLLSVQSNPVPHQHPFNAANQHEIWLTRPDHRCWCSDHWQSSCPYLAPIPPWHVVQQALLTTTDFSTIDAAGIVSPCARILSKELHQGLSPSVSAIRRKMSIPSKDKCNYCGGTGHLEKDCRCKQCRLSHEDTQAERKEGNKKGKGKKGKEKEKNEEQTPCKIVYNYLEPL